MTTSPINLTSFYASYYSANKDPEVLQLEPVNYIAVAGKGKPGNEDFCSAVKALEEFSLAVKQHTAMFNRDFLIPNLEGIWWLEEGQDFFAVAEEEWHWRLQIRMPDFITPIEIERLKRSKTFQSERFHQICFFTRDAHASVQAMHRGSYQNEKSTIEKLRKFILENGWECSGPHHEIYLTDPNHTKEEQLQTIIRYPIKVS